MWMTVGVDMCLWLSTANKIKNCDIPPIVNWHDTVNIWNKRTLRIELNYKHYLFVGFIYLTPCPLIKTTEVFLVPEFDIRVIWKIPIQLTKDKKTSPNWFVIAISVYSLLNYTHLKKKVRYFSAFVFYSKIRICTII